MLLSLSCGVVIYFIEEKLRFENSLFCTFLAIDVKKVPFVRCAMSTNQAQTTASSSRSAGAIAQQVREIQSNGQQPPTPQQHIALVLCYFAADDSNLNSTPCMAKLPERMPLQR